MLSKVKTVSSALALSVGLLTCSQGMAAAPILNQMQAEGQLPSLAPMLKQVLPGVVNISVKGKKEVQNQGFQFPEEFNFFFPGMEDFGFGPGPRNRKPQHRQFQALGSGVIINAKDGLVVTNNHVVDDADEITVQLSDGHEYKAKLLGADKHTDLALLQIKDAKNLTEIRFTENPIEVGDFAVAIGNPYGLGQTVTSGIVSALGRSGLNIENIENFIQTDAAINSGNSGGALINLNGELIGINTAIMAPSGGNIGIGFAIPSGMVKTVTDQLLKYGEVKRGLLGVMGSELTPDLAQSFGYDGNSGAFINEVMKGSGAEEAGIKSGDIITAVNGKKITSFSQLRAEVATQRAGEDIDITIFRDGKYQDLKVKLKDDIKKESSSSVSEGDAEDISPALAGASLSNGKKGVKVDDVVRGSMAMRLGLRRGDLITGVNRVEIEDLDVLKKELDKVEGKISAIRINRHGQTIYITLR